MHASAHVFAPARTSAPGSVRQPPDADAAALRLREIAGLFSLRGEEACTQSGLPRREHALQCAFLAEREGQAPPLIIAALLHDVGSLLGAAPAVADEVGVDWLQARFGAATVAPVRLQSTAGRYLHTIEPLDAGQAVGAATGPMGASERRAFQALEAAADAVALYRIRRRAHVRHLVVPPLRSYLPYIAVTLAG